MSDKETSYVLSHDDALALAVSQKNYLSKLRLRAAIEDEAGDIRSLLGTTNDAMQMLFYHFSKVILELEKINSIDDVKSVGENFRVLAKDFIDSVESDSTSLTLKTKGEKLILNDIKSRSNIISLALAN
ncbi:hypothetical protein [uncultured Shewanella sp.]|uniref:hypothetical protein n=1 Tax=uncultured Shewanella sp. TaxID=173975 RepID=UPI00260C93B2|nr:hypothetical protein [uncultured Shewanella sp.]